VELPRGLHGQHPAAARGEDQQTLPYTLNPKP
jgi:hypothetical protein